MVTTEGSCTPSVLFSGTMINRDLLTVNIDLTSLLWVESICVNMDRSCFIWAISWFFCVVRLSLWSWTSTVSSIVMAHFEMSFFKVVLHSIKAIEWVLIVVLWIVKLLQSLLSQLSIDNCLLLVFFHFIWWSFVSVWTGRPKSCWISGFGKLEVVSGNPDWCLSKCLLDHLTV